MRKRHAHQIRRGIILARQVDRYAEGIGWNPTTLAATMLTIGMQRAAQLARSTPLTSRAYERELTARRRSPRDGGRPESEGGVGS